MPDTTTPPLCERCGQNPAEWDSELCTTCIPAAIAEELSCDWLDDDEEN